MDIQKGDSKEVKMRKIVSYIRSICPDVRTDVEHIDTHYHEEPFCTFTYPEDCMGYLALYTYKHGIYPLYGAHPVAFACVNRSHKIWSKWKEPDLGCKVRDLEDFYKAIPFSLYTDIFHESRRRMRQREEIQRSIDNVDNILVEILPRNILDIICSYLTAAAISL